MDARLLPPDEGLWWQGPRLLLNLIILVGMQSDLEDTFSEQPVNE